jgi:hypothetical protein
MKKSLFTRRSLQKAMLFGCTVTALSLGTAHKAAAWNIIDQFSYVDGDGCIQIGTTRSFLGFEWTTYDSPNC